MYIHGTYTLHNIHMLHKYIPNVNSFRRLPEFVGLILVRKKTNGIKQFSIKYFYCRYMESSGLFFYFAKQSNISSEHQNPLSNTALHLLNNAKY